MLKTFQLTTSKQNATNYQNSKNSTGNSKLHYLWRWPKSIVESTCAEVMGQFLYHLDPDPRKIWDHLDPNTRKIWDLLDPNSRKITRSLEKIELKIINSVPSSLTKLAWIITCCLNIHFSIYIYIYDFKDPTVKGVNYWTIYTQVICLSWWMCL